MEFFAVIGLITVIWLIYDLTKYVFIDCDKELEAEKNEENATTRSQDDEPGSDLDDEQGTENISMFIDNLSCVDALFDPVFKPLPATRNAAAIEFNLLLKEIGSYARLYSYLKSVYGSNLPASAFGMETKVRFEVYQAELLRRDAYLAFFEYKLPILPSENPFTEAETIRLHSLTNALQNCADCIADYYAEVRHVCFYSINLSRTARTDRIYRIHDAERIHFRGDLALQQKLNDSVNDALRNVFVNPPFN